LPFVAIAICLICLLAERRGHAALRKATATILPVFWLSATLTAVILYPFSARRFLAPVLLSSAVVLSIYWLSFRRQSVPGTRLILAAIPAIAAAVAFVFTLRAGDADTTPLNATIPVFERNVPERLAVVPIRLSDDVDVQTSEGRVVIHRRAATQQ